MAKTNPHLEAAITKDPDDEDAYLVYGDWLLAEDDPRGALIALHAAALRDPADKKLARRVDKHLEQHAGALLGELADRGKEVVLVWHLGFVRDARFAFSGASAGTHARDALRALLDHPSGKFVQSIIMEGNGIDPDPVVELLLSRRPATLADLRIGRTWDPAKDAPELYEVFPRLHRALDAEWRRIAQVVADQRKTDLKYTPAELPVLVAKQGIGAPGVDNEQILRALKLEIDKGRDQGVVAAMKRSFTRESLDRFVVAIAAQFAELGESTALRWGFQTLGLLGDALAVTWIAERFGSWSHQRAVQGAGMLGEIRSGLALWELYALVSDSRRMRARREESRGVIENIARARSLDVDAMLDRSLPALHARSERVNEAVVRRLVAHMIDGRRISHTDFVHYFVSHPLVAPLVRRLVWATYDRGDVETTFRIDDDGNALDISGEQIDLADASVGVWHPAEVAEDERASLVDRWQKVFARHKIAPPLEQLARPVQALRDREDGPVVVRFKLRSVGFDQLRSILDHQLDWNPVQEDTDGGLQTLGWERFYARDNVTATAMLTERAGGIEHVTITRSGKPYGFAKVHPVTASEVLYAIDRATTREQPDAVGQLGAIERGMRVQITRGAGRLREGVVFWLGDGNNGPRCGLRADDDETLWAALEDVKPIAPREPDQIATPDKPRPSKGAKASAAKPSKPAKAAADKPDPDQSPKPALAKGTHVRWTTGRSDGTGTVFWIGKNKFGDGMRAGVKDDETGETVWADANDCTPD